MKILWQVYAFLITFTLLCQLCLAKPFENGGRRYGHHRNYR